MNRGGGGRRPVGNASRAGGASRRCPRRVGAPWEGTLDRHEPSFDRPAGGRRHHAAGCCETKIRVQYGVLRSPLFGEGPST
eukprot:5360369-Alexandrium_andersonii.AAC.1